MNIALPILLLVVGAITCWVLNESTLKWYIGTALITSFCAFTIFFYTQIHSFLGWAAEQGDIPDKMSVHWIIIKEPNKLLQFEGKIYILIESVDNNNNFLYKLFGYKQEGVEPRLHEMDYDRELHEQLEKIKGRLMDGQPVLGELREVGKGKRPDKDGDQEGDGSESQNVKWEFHELRPSDFLNKPSSIK